MFLSFYFTNFFLPKLTYNRIKLINTDGMDVEEMEDVEKKELADMIKCVKEIAFMTKEVLIKGKEGI